MIKLLIIVFFINAAQVFCAPKRGCPKIPAVPVDENFAKSKFTIIRHAGTEVFRKVDKKFEFMGKPIAMKSVCWGYTAILEDGTEYKTKIKCDYHSISNQYCNIEKEDQERFLSTKSTITMTSTDNSTYVAGVVCVGARGAFWLIATKNGDSLDAAVEKSVFEIFEKAGLNTTNVANKESPIIFKDYTVNDDKECE